MLRKEPVIGQTSTFGQLLRSHRERAGLSQEALAERAGITSSAISALERGVRRRPYPRTLRLLGAALQLSPAELAALASARASRARASGRGDFQGKAGVPASKLPLPRTPLIGRSTEIRGISGVFRAGVCRLVTLTGVGGSGKTRLGLAVASEVGKAFPGGVWFVDLSAIVDAGFVPNAMAAVLGVHEAASMPLLESLSVRLGHTEGLLVLDNCEHLIEGCAEVVGYLLAACPDLRILATSREPLHVQGEQVWPVSPLAIPSVEVSDYLNEANRSPAVQLFSERARAVLPAFQLTEHNAAAVNRICARLDGIPLALELAAARVRVLSIEQILERLDDVFGLLTSSSRVTPARQQTLRATLDWSYGLLSESEKAVFRPMAVFAGGFDLSAIEAVCADEGFGSAGALDLITRLVDKSLVVASVDAPIARYCQLEPVRRYGESCLDAKGQWDSTRKRHATYYRDFAERACRGFDGPLQIDWLGHLEREQGNLRVALAWALEGRHAETGLRLAGALVPFWEIRGHLSEGRRWLKALLDAAGERGLSPSVRARALLGAARLANWQVDFEDAARLCEESLALCRELCDARGIAESLVWTSVTYRNRGDLAQALPIVEESLSLYNELGDQAGVAEAVRNLSIIARLEGDTGRAVALAEESLKLFEEVGDERHIARGRTQLGSALLQQGDLQRARVLFTEALLGHVRVSDRWFVGHALTGLAAVHAGTAQMQQAARLLGAAHALHESLGTPLIPVIRASHEQLLTQVREGLSRAEFRRAWEEGQALTPGMAVAEAAHSGIDPSIVASLHWPLERGKRTAVRASDQP